jgi:hypothetical protein
MAKVLRLSCLAGAFVALATLFLSGCGGGSAPTAIGLVYQTRFLDSGSINGQSQLVTLLTLDGVALESRVVNVSDGAQQQITFQRSNGTYRVQAELFTQPNLQGTKVGVAVSLVTVAGGYGEFRTQTGASPSSLVVTPTFSTFTVQQSRQFYATGYAGQDAVFLEAGSITWEALGGVATVSADGTAIGIAEGTGSIRARHTPTGLSGAAAITVTPFVTTKTKWTILVYLNAANDLYQFSTLNVNQMESVAQNPEVRFVLQWKQSQVAFPGSSFDGTRRYLVKPDTSGAIASELLQDMGTAVDMGLPETLRDFVSWGQTYFPADRTILIIWNHGSGWRRGSPEPPNRAVSFDDETGNAIQTWQLNQALGSAKLEVLAWDASLMQMLEVAYEVRTKVPLVVGSEESPPGEGYPYDLIFAKFRDNPDLPTRELVKEFVNAMLAVPAYKSRKITQSILETAALEPLAQAVSQLADALLAHQANIATQVQAARNLTQSYSQTSTRYYRDLYDLTLKLDGQPNMPVDILAANAQVRHAIGDVMVFEGHNDLSPGSHGISIDFSPATTFGVYAQDYGLLGFAAATKWDEWLEVAP